MQFMEELISHFSVIPDPRQNINIKHDLSDILILSVFGVVAGCDSWVEIERFGLQKIDWLKNFLSLKNGIPSHDTIARVVSLVDSTQLQKVFRDWALSCANNPKIKHIALDGKVVKATSSKQSKFDHLGLVSAFASEQGLCLGYKSCSLKNEKQGFEDLINLLDLKNSIVTIDANGLTASIMNAIVEKKGKFIIAVKSPNEALKRGIEDKLDKAEKDSYMEDISTSHGRIEQRMCEVATLSRSFNETLKRKRSKEYCQGVYPTLNSCMRVKSVRIDKGQEAEEERYYISNLKNPDAKRSCELIRSHWSIENELHWSLDVTFSEDRCCVKKKAFENFAGLRRFCLNLLKNESTEKISMRVKRKMASWDDQFLLKVLLGREFEANA